MIENLIEKNAKPWEKSSNIKDTGETGDDFLEMDITTL